ncbi:hypothetical protein ARMSODRAFT_608391 [Armillaria solidipes]|uniref:Uncharacterized protein n=1 Tax=Armillaria solidipes TaxID=1076256 RepID=A0A2H3AU22_9AGAR|nr:hypothetical protein ARMSODRAFT_608391 [Armillaria solidipes]
MLYQKSRISVQSKPLAGVPCASSNVLRSKAPDEGTPNSAGYHTRDFGYAIKVVQTCLSPTVSYPGNVRLVSSSLTHVILFPFLSGANFISCSGTFFEGLIWRYTRQVRKIYLSGVIFCLYFAVDIYMLPFGTVNTRVNFTVAVSNHLLAAAVDVPILRRNCPDSSLPQSWSIML